MLKYVVPQISPRDLPPMLGVSTIGAAIAGVYGITHDLITFTISPEYFRNLKFQQFQYADAGLGEHVFVMTIGFLATSWVGFVTAWFLARRLVPSQPRGVAYRQIAIGLVCVFFSALVFGCGGYLYGVWKGPTGDYSLWTYAIQEFAIADTWSFVRVAYIHNAGYLGGLIGLAISLVCIRPRKERCSHS